MISLNTSGATIDEAVVVLAQHFKMPDVTLSPTNGRFTWSHRAVGDSAMVLRSVRFVGTLDATLDSGLEFVVQWNRAGRVAFESKRTSTHLAPGVPFVSPNGRSEMRTRMTDVNLNLIHIKRSLVESVAEELDDVHFVTFDVVAPTSARALSSWRKTLDLVASVALDADEPASSLLRREMSRMIAIAMLTNFPFQSVPRVSMTVGIEPSSMREAYEFVHHNAHLAIGTTDVAHATGLSVRALRLALHRYREITPTALIQSIRLELVHTQLQAAEPKTTSVSVVARDWGFIHLGRFAAAYRRLHGESPSQTLSRTASIKHYSVATLNPASLF